MVHHGADLRVALTEVPGHLREGLRTRLRKGGLVVPGAGMLEQLGQGLANLFGGQ